MKAIIFQLGLIITALLLLWGIIAWDFIPVVGGVTIGILTYLHYKAVRRNRCK